MVTAAEEATEETAVMDMSLEKIATAQGQEEEEEEAAAAAAAACSCGPAPQMCH